MRKLRWRLTFTILAIVICSSFLGVLANAMIRSHRLFDPELEKVILSGLAFRDLIILFITISGTILLTFIISRRTSSPVIELDQAMKEIAKVNYDVEVKINRRTEEYTSLQQNFNIMARELKSNEYLQKSFMANVSHELKTPISIINGYSKLLCDPDLDTQTRLECAEYISRETERLATMTGNMLKISRLDAQGIPNKYDVFSLDEQLRRTILQLEPRWTAKDIFIDLSLPQIFFCGDEELLAHVWYNLTDNAIKFSPAGSTVSLSLDCTEEFIRVVVSDNGIGMSPEVTEHIFDQFYRGENSDKDQGSGLGLPLTKRICEFHGGKITVSSEPGKGSVFTVLLPNSGDKN
ncbi:MAG: HAMP domain-containing histidine kinase [Clostridia bacterium]|nr:HAMP domain-containing histidine kinase [Clostridia bacterium]